MRLPLGNMMWLAAVGLLLIRPTGDLCAQEPFLSRFANFSENPFLSSSSLSSPDGSADWSESEFLDFDAYRDHDSPSSFWRDEDWTWQILPKDLIYKSYLAGVKESRFSAHLISIREDSFIWETTVGSRVGLFRYGDNDPIRPQGFQLDVEGSAQVRLDIPEEVDVRSVDFRGGLPLTFGYGRHQTKFAYYHLSSHLGDEFLLKNPMFPRLNFSRDVLVLGQSYYLTDELRIYAEAGWAFYTIVSQPWEFQFGADFAPAHPTGPAGAPFFAINGHLRQDVNYGGNATVQVGWAWLSPEDRKLLRMGLHLFVGESSQFSFFDNHEEQIGFGVWYDY